MIPATTTADLETISIHTPWETKDDNDIESYETENSSIIAIQRLLDSLPRNLHLDKLHLSETRSSFVSSPVLGTLGEEADEELEENKDSEADDEGLKIAWQYRKSVQRERLGQGSQSGPNVSPSLKTRTTTIKSHEFCHSYDLQGFLVDQLNVSERVFILDYANDSNDLFSFGLYLEMKAKLDDLFEEGRNKVVRILFYHTPLSALDKVLPLLLSYVREHEVPVVMMVLCRRSSLPPDVSTVVLNGLKRCSDVVMEVEGFTSRRHYPPPSEFRMFHGLLKVRQCSTLTATTANGRGGHFADMTSGHPLHADLFGLKRDRRKLHIQMLHIPPEDQVESGGSVGTGGVRAGAGMPGKDVSGAKASHRLACSTSGGLDF